MTPPHRALAISVLCLCMLAGVAWGITAPAKVAYVEGKVMVLRSGSKTPVPAELGMSLFYGDQVKTLSGKCQINMTASGILRLSPSTTVLLPTEENTGDKISVTRMLAGKTATNYRQLFMDEVFEVRTPSLAMATQDGGAIADEAHPGHAAALEQWREGRRKEIERLRAELKAREGRPTSRACPACGGAGPHRATAEGWECNCGATVCTFGNYPTSQGTYNGVKESYQVRIAEIEQAMR